MVKTETSKKAEPTSANLRALETTVQAYEQAIIDLEAGDVEGVHRRWAKWGTWYGCHLCVSVWDQAVNCQDCERCVLGPEDFGCMDQTYARLNTALCEEESADHLLDALRGRLRHILQLAKLNGIILVPRKGRG